MGLYGSEFRVSRKRSPGQESERLRSTRCFQHIIAAFAQKPHFPKACLACRLTRTDSPNYCKQKESFNNKAFVSTQSAGHHRCPGPLKHDVKGFGCSPFQAERRLQRTLSMPLGVQCEHRAWQILLGGPVSFRSPQASLYQRASGSCLESGHLIISVADHPLPSAVP